MGAVFANLNIASPILQERAFCLHPRDKARRFYASLGIAAPARKHHPKTEQPEVDAAEVARALAALDEQAHKLEAIENSPWDVPLEDDSPERIYRRVLRRLEADEHSKLWPRVHPRLRWYAGGANLWRRVWGVAL